MDTKQKIQSLIEHRRKKQTKQQKDSEQLNKIAEARNIFLKSQNITPDTYNEHDVYMTMIQKRFYELCKWAQLTVREFVNVNILNGNSPKELYLIRKMDEPKVNDFHRALTQEYTTTQCPLMYCIKAGLICVAKTTKGWQRCRILKLHENSIDGLLFDIGIIERVNWHDLRIIKEQFTTKKPMAIRCTLINVITTQPIERFTIQDHQQFLQILKEQHDFYIFVNRPNFMSSDIYLYYKSDNQFHCVNNIFPAQTLTDNSSTEDEVTSEAIIANTSSAKSKSTSSDLSKSKSKHETHPVQEEIRTERIPDPIQTDDNNDSFVTELSDDMPPKTIEPRPDSHVCLIERYKISKPWNVIVKHIVSIDEIYVCFVKYVEALNRIRFDVQNYVETVSPSEKNCWAIDEYCLAVDPTEGSGEWLRGKIVEIQAPDSCMVFLRDVGKTIKCKTNSLKEISKELQIVRDFTWKMKLSSVKIAKHWTKSMIKHLLHEMIESYDEMAISAVGDNNAGNDWGVILWGIQKIFNALSPERTEFININESLVERGAATTDASFGGIMEIVNPPSTEIIDEGPKLFDDVQATIERMKLFNFEERQALCSPQMVTDKRAEVKCWLPSEQIHEKKFVAFPMYVSRKLIIHVLEANRKNMSDEIKDILEKKYRKNQLERKDSIEWKKEDACFARYDGDDRFYRATIRRVNYAKNSCVVRFIDFGNCDTCSLDDLRKATMFGDIPILIRHYQLHNIQSSTADGFWPDYVQNFCTDLIVERHCDLIVIDDQHTNGAIPDVEYCHLNLMSKHKDLATALISRGYAKLVDKPNSEAQSPISH